MQSTRWLKAQLEHLREELQLKSLNGGCHDRSTQLTLKQAADRFSISEKEIVALVADKKLDYVWEQTSSGNLLLVYQDQLCDVAFLRDEDPEVFEKHLKSGLLRMMEAGATALTIEFLKNVEIDKLLELIQRLPQMLPGLAEESAEFEYKDEA